jgi:glycosyltransferase involved in cell wall biosynthesis
MAAYVSGTTRDEDGHSESYPRPNIPPTLGTIETALSYRLPFEDCERISEYSSAMGPMNHDPLVSVILPVYNGAAFLGSALESALSQTYRHLEIIAIDDGSTDGTPAVLDLYALRDSRIRVLTQANGGVARARNRGIAEAHGNFIAPLDADDLWEPTKIDRQMQRMLAAGNETGFVYSWWVWIDASGSVLDRSPRWMFEGHIFESLLQINFTGNASVPLFRRHCVEEAGGYNEQLAATSAGGCEDWELVLRVAERYKAAVVPEILLGYRRRPGSMSTACDTMWRSQQRVVQAMRELRPDLNARVPRRAAHQFAMYLAGLCFWSGNMVAAFRWGLRSGCRLPFLVAPHVIRMLLNRKRRKTALQTMRPGVTLDTQRTPEPLLPYDKIRTLRSPEWNKAH